MNILGDFKRESRYDPDLARRLNEEIEQEEKRKALKDKLIKKKTPEQKLSQAPPQTPPTVSATDDFWRISNVNYRNGICTVDLAKALLDNGAAKTQDEWSRYREAVPQNGFYPGDMPFYHALFTVLFKQKDKPESEEARAFIQEQMRNNWLTTLTRIAYQPRGKDKIIHNFGTKDQYEVEENIIGKNQVIEQADSKALEALLGTSDVNKIKQVYNWINQTPVYIWRLNKKPENIDERVARFVAVSGWVGLDCGGFPQVSGSALGVRLVA